MGDFASAYDFFSPPPLLGGDVVQTTVVEQQPDQLDLKGRSITFTLAPSPTTLTNSDIRILFEVKIASDEFEAPALEGAIAMPPLLPALLFEQVNEFFSTAESKGLQF